MPTLEATARAALGILAGAGDVLSRAELDLGLADVLRWGQRPQAAASVQARAGVRSRQASPSTQHACPPSAWHWIP